MKRVKTECIGYLNNNNFEDISSSGREKLKLLHQIQDKVDQYSELIPFYINYLVVWWKGNIMVQISTSIGFDGPFCVVAFSVKYMI